MSKFVLLINNSISNDFALNLPVEAAVGLVLLELLALIAKKYEDKECRINLAVVFFSISGARICINA